MPLKKVIINTTLTLKNNRTLALAWVPNCPNRDFSLGPEVAQTGL